MPRGAPITGITGQDGSYLAELLQIMVDADLESVGLRPLGAGRRLLERGFAPWHRGQSSVSAVLSTAASAAH